MENKCSEQLASEMVDERLDIEINKQKDEGKSPW